MYNSTLIKKIKVPQLFSQATTSSHPNIFTFTLSLSEGRAGEAEETSRQNDALSLPFPHNNKSLQRVE
jgi:hypothetical protein